MVYVCNAMRRKLANDAYEAKHPELGGERARYRDAAVRAIADMRKRFPILTAENFDEADEYRKTRISQLTGE